MEWIIICGVLGVLCLGMAYSPLGTWRCAWVEKHLEPGRREKFEAIATRETRAGQIRRDERYRWQWLGLLCLVGAGIAAILYGQAEPETAVQTLARPAFGEGAATITLQVTTAQGSWPCEVRVKEQVPGEEERQAFFQKVAEDIFSYALGENESPGHVNRDLRLVDSWDSVEVAWDIADRRYISSAGHLRGDISPEGQANELTAWLTYGSYRESFGLTVCLYPPMVSTTTEEEWRTFLEEEAVLEDEALRLPDQRGEEAVHYAKAGTQPHRIWLLLVAVAAVLWWIVSRDRLDQLVKKREAELQRDYPRLLSRLSILLAAGLSIPAAWRRMAEEYEQRLARGAKPSAGYEEWRLAANQLENTGQMEMALGFFARRCRDRHYRQLATMLSQSMQKGSVALQRQLDQALEEGFRMRKENARVEGEKAQTRLLLPSFLLFGLVLAMVMVPAMKGM